MTKQRVDELFKQELLNSTEFGELLQGIGQIISERYEDVQKQLPFEEWLLLLLNGILK